MLAGNRLCQILLNWLQPPVARAPFTRRCWHWFDSPAFCSQTSARYTDPAMRVQAPPCSSSLGSVRATAAPPHTQLFGTARSTNHGRPAHDSTLQSKWASR